MRKRSRRREDQAEVNMTPMLDIVFILLIFFIVTATFLAGEGIDMRPPPDCTGPDCGTGPPPIVVQVDSENQVFVNQVRTDVDRVLAAVNRHRAEEPAATHRHPLQLCSHGTSAFFPAGCPAKAGRRAGTDRTHIA